MGDFPFPKIQVSHLSYNEKRVRETLPGFLDSLRHPRRSMKHFSVMVPGDKAQPVWLTSLQHHSSNIRGRVVSTPGNECISDQECSVCFDDIIDWLYVHNLRLIGGASFRVRVMEAFGYLKCLQRGSALPPRPADEDLDYLDRIEQFCLPFDEDARRGALFELFDAIGNHEQENTRELMADRSLLNARCDVAVMKVISVGRDSLTPLLYAIECGNEPAAVLCIEGGAHLELRTSNGMTALHLALHASPRLVRLLIEKGADIEARTDVGYTPLTLAVTSGSYESMRVLISAGANANDYHQLIIPDSTMLSTVSPVLSGGLDLEAAKILHEAGARFDVKDHKGETALHIAAFNNEFDLAEFLIEIGCDPFARTDDGETPAILAQKFPGDPEAAAQFAEWCEQFKR